MTRFGRAAAYGIFRAAKTFFSRPARLSPLIRDARLVGGASGARRFTSDELRQLAEAEAAGQRLLIDRLGPLAPKVDYTSTPMHPAIAREFNDALRRLSDRFPEQMAKLKRIGVGDPKGRFVDDGSGGGLGAYSVLRGEDRGIYFDARKLGDPDAVTARFTANMDAGWLSGGWSSPQAIVHHEFGHQILADLPASAEPGLNQAIRDVLGRRVDVQGGVFHPETAARVREGLGAYAATEPHEMIAEGIAEYMSGRSPRPLATAIGDYLSRIH